MSLVTSGCSKKTELGRQSSAVIVEATPGVVEGSDKPSPKLNVELGLQGEHLYLIQFQEQPLATYTGGIQGLAPTSPMAPENRRLGMRKLDAKSAASLAYKSFLAQRQSAYLAQIANRTGRTRVVRTFRNALNAVSMRMTQSEALKVSRMPEVKYVERDVPQEIETDRGPAFIGADTAWDGTATGTSFMGEGITVGVIDTGIAIDIIEDFAVTDHPSFAEVGGDGYVHTNPLGDGVYLGGCVENPGWCNNKLIGVYSFLSGYDNVEQNAPNSSEIWLYKDINGHGSHTASTAAGNVLLDVPLYNVDNEPNQELSFPRISGVAPHANIVMFKICAPSCFTTDTAASVEQAIEDGVVDVLNYSIGVPGGSPWNTGTSSAFLSARAAGIYVAASAGNDGPGLGTAGRGSAAPWSTSVAAVTHDRVFPPKQLNSLGGGGTTPPANMTGAGLTDGFTGPIVWARDFPVGSPGQPNFDEPEQCLEPFPAGTFQPTMIVLCDRGTIARVDKGRNVRDGGAGAFILANLTGQADNIVDDPHVIPGVHVSAANGDLLRTWLNSGAGHTGTIAASLPPVYDDPTRGDITAGFSSRGPYAGFDFLAPSVAAPGVSIFAAGAQVLFDNQGPVSVPALFGAISGTSMASPHIAGTAALMRGLRPEWTDAEILSALITTGTRVGVKEDGVTPVDTFDVGGGRVRIDQAARAGLVFDELSDDFIAGDPDRGGDPRSLNIAALIADSCGVRCTWERTVRATAAGTWTIDTPTYITASQTSITLTANQTQTIVFEADASGLPADDYSQGAVTFTPSDGNLPVQVMPVVLAPVPDNIPRSLVLLTDTDSGSHTLSELLHSEAIDELTFAVHGIDKATTLTFELPEDTDLTGDFNNFFGALDDLQDGVAIHLFEVPAAAQRLIAELPRESNAAGFAGVWIGEDLNGDGIPTVDEYLCADFGDGMSYARCDFSLDPDRAAPSQFWALVHNRDASVAGATDSIGLLLGIVSNGTSGNISATGTGGAIAAAQAFEAEISYDQAMEVGDIHFGRVAFYRSAVQDDTTLLAVTDLKIIRLEDPQGMPDAGTEPDAGMGTPDAGGSQPDAMTPGGGDDDDGCGCVVGGASQNGGTSAPLWLLAGLMVLAWRRRRRA